MSLTQWPISICPAERRGNPPITLQNIGAFSNPFLSLEQTESERLGTSPKPETRIL